MIDKYDIYDGFPGEINNSADLDKIFKMIGKGFATGFLDSQVFGINFPLFIVGECNKALNREIFDRRKEFFLKVNYDEAYQHLIDGLARADELYKEGPLAETIKSQIQSWNFAGKRCLTAKIFNDDLEDGFRLGNALELFVFQSHFSNLAKAHNVRASKIAEVFPCTYRTYVDSHHPEIRVGDSFMAFSKNPYFNTQWNSKEVLILGIKEGTDKTY